MLLFAGAAAAAAAAAALVPACPVALLLLDDADGTLTRPQDGDGGDAALLPLVRACNRVRFAASAASAADAAPATPFTNSFFAFRTGWRGGAAEEWYGRTWVSCVWWLALR